MWRVLLLQQYILYYCVYLSIGVQHLLVLQGGGASLAALLGQGGGGGSADRGRGSGHPAPAGDALDLGLDDVLQVLGN